MYTFPVFLERRENSLATRCTASNTTTRSSRGKKAAASCTICDRKKLSLSLSFILERKETTRLTQGRSKKEEPFLFFLLPKRCPQRCLRGKDFEERIFDRSSALKSAKERMARIQRDRVWRVSVRIKLSFEAQNAFSISIRGG